MLRMSLKMSLKKAILGLIVICAFSLLFFNCSSKNKWYQFQYDLAVENCVANVPITVSSEFGEIYCDCVMNIASQRYEFSDFAENEGQYVDELENDGTIEQCNQKALEMTEAEQ